MPSYLVGVLVAFIEPVAHGYANVLDRYFSGEVFDQRMVFLALSCCVSLCFIPIVWMLDPPQFLSSTLFCLVLLATLLEILYVFPYYKALQEADTSVVASLFDLGDAFIPFLAFVFVGERLAWSQYAGFFIIIFSSTLLTINLRKMRFNRAFLLMLLSSTLVSLQVVVIKVAYDLGLTWGSLIVWMTVLQAVEVFLIVALVPANRRAFKNISSAMRGNWGRYAALEVLTWVGTKSSYLAITFIPVTVAVAIANTQPVFPLIYAWLFGKRNPELYREYLDRANVIKKVFLFSCIIVGAVLTVYY